MGIYIKCVCCIGDIQRINNLEITSLNLAYVYMIYTAYSIPTQQTDMDK
jgi:hypothetical protein